MKLFSKIEDVISSIQEQNMGILVREIKNKQTLIYVIYLPYITAKDKLTEEIIKPLIQYSNTISSSKQIMESIIYPSDLSIDSDFSKIVEYTLAGKSIIGISNGTNYIVADTTQVAQRNVSVPEVQYALRAPRDSFIENLETNLSLISYRIKDPHLTFKNFIVGEKTQTKVVVAYLDNLADKNIVKYVTDTIESITIDGILESSYIEKVLNGKTRRIFPIIAISERSDKACATILKGRICVLVEGSNLALMLPQRFMDFLDSGDDHYSSPLVGPFNTSLRVFGIASTYSLPALYLVVTSFNPDMLPSSYLLSIASARSAVPLNAVLEIFFMTVVIEMLREASIRLPTKIGSAIGIVGGIVIGQGAISAGLTSPISVVIVSFSSIASFILPDYSIVLPLNVLKFALIIITAFLGLFGFVIGLSFLAVHLISNNSFGVPYAEPIAPFTSKEVKDEFLPKVAFYKEKDSNSTNPYSDANSDDTSSGKDNNSTYNNANYTENKYNGEKNNNNSDKNNSISKNDNTNDMNENKNSNEGTSTSNSNSNNCKDNNKNNNSNFHNAKEQSNNNDSNKKNTEEDTNNNTTDNNNTNDDNEENMKSKGILRKILDFFKDDDSDRNTDENNSDTNNDTNNDNGNDSSNNNTNTPSSDSKN